MEKTQSIKCRPVAFDLGPVIYLHVSTALAIAKITARPGLNFKARPQVCLFFLFKIGSALGKCLKNRHKTSAKHLSQV